MCDCVGMELLRRLDVALVDVERHRQESKERGELWVLAKGRAEAAEAANRVLAQRAEAAEARAKEVEATLREIRHGVGAVRGLEENDVVAQ